MAGEVVHQLDHFVRGDRGKADLQGEESHLEVALLSASLSVEENRIARQFKRSKQNDSSTCTGGKSC